jgi:hypothetical protein
MKPGGLDAIEQGSGGTIGARQKTIQTREVHAVLLKTGKLPITEAMVVIAHNRFERGDHSLNFFHLDQPPCIARGRKEP